MCNQWCLEFAKVVPPFFEKPARILEVGSRNVNGSLRDELSQCADKYIGVDLFDGPGVDIVLNVAELSSYFDRQSFDLVASTEMLEHCLNWQDALYQMASVLRQDGLMLITTRSPGFELHDYPADHWRFSYDDFEKLFKPLGDILAIQNDLTLGWPCGIGILVKKKLDQSRLLEWKLWLDTFPVYSMKDEGFPLKPLVESTPEVMIFDQYSRYKACSELIRQVGFVPGTSILDIGSGPECLFGQFMPDAAMTYLDPLIPMGSGKEHITGDIFSDELDGKYFDCVSAVDVLEHVPPQHRQAFLERFSSLGKDTLILGFPTSDSSDATKTDKAIDDEYRTIYGHDYSWLEEHYRFGLPSLAETVEQLTQLGWHCQSVGHGHAPWLQELLAFVICVWDVPGLQDVVLEISEKFNREFYPFDFRPPYYRQFVIATRSSQPPIAIPVNAGNDLDVEASFRELMAVAHHSYFAASIRHFGNIGLKSAERDAEAARQIAERDAEIARLNAKIEEVSTWGIRLQEISTASIKKLSDKQEELMRISDWADGMRRKLEGRDTLFVRKAIRAAAGKVRRYIANSAFGNMMQHVWDRRRFQKTKVTFAAVSESLAANDGKLIITFPIITWDFRWQRPQHIVTRLRNRGYSVLYVAMSLAKLGRKIRNRNEAGALLGFNMLDQHVQQIWLHSAGNVNIYTDTIGADDLHNLVCGLDAAISELKPKSIHYLLQFPGWWPIVEKLRERHGGKVIFDCMDDHAGFSTNTTQALQTEEHLIKNADLVITSSDVLEGKVRFCNPSTVKVKNGTEFEHFSQPKSNGELDHLLGNPIIGYYGAISDWFDMEIVAYCAKAHPDWSFVLIGATTGADLRPIERLSNVYLLGEKKYVELPGYLAYFDICTIPFKISPLTLATNPVKFYEYLSAGKPVVSVALPELLMYSQNCYLADNVIEFDGLLIQALAEKDDLEKIASRTKLAKENSWDSRVEAIVEAMRAL